MKFVPLKFFSLDVFNILLFLTLFSTFSRENSRELHLFSKVEVTSLHFFLILDIS